MRFYCEGLGFRERSALRVEGEPTSTLLELPDVVLEARYLERDGTVVELLHYPAQDVRGDGAARPMNALGLTHLSFRVDDLDATALSLVALGGRELRRVANADLGLGAVFLADPDGTRIELVAGRGDPTRLPGEAG